MMQQTLTPIAPETQAALQLAQGIQRGAVAPMTPEGQPTVVGRMLQQVAPQPATPPMAGGMPPGLPQMRQNAGIASQIDMMEKQKAQQAMMQQAEAMANARRTAPVLGGGIAMAPGAQGMRMAEGGIVGYAGAGAVAAPDYSKAEEMRKQGLGAFEKYETEPPAPADIGQRMQAQEAEYRRQLQARGLDPDFLAKEIARREELSKREVAQYADREREERENARQNAIISGLIGARGKNPFGPYAAGSMESEAASQASIRKSQDAALAAQKAAAAEQFALRQAQHATAMGDWKSAQEWLAKAQEAKNALALEEGKQRIQAAGQMGQEATSAAQIAAQIRGQDVSKEVARIGAAAREGGIGGKAVNMAATRLQSNQEYKDISKALLEKEMLPSAAKAFEQKNIETLRARKKSLEAAMEAAFGLEPGVLEFTMKSMEGGGAGAGAGAAGALSLPPGVTVKRVQ